MLELHKHITKTHGTCSYCFTSSLSQPTFVVSWKVPYDKLIKEEKVWALFMDGSTVN